MINDNSLKQAAANKETLALLVGSAVDDGCLMGAKQAAANKANLPIAAGLTHLREAFDAT